MAVPKEQKASSLTHTMFSILANPDGASLKRIAWAYGCSKKGSSEEEQLYSILVAKAKMIVVPVRNPKE